MVKPREMTILALRQSIAHWHANAYGPIEEASTKSNDCALCNLYLIKGMTDEEACEGCPVFAKTGLKFCDSTPYIYAYLALFDLRIPREKGEIEAESEMERNWRREANRELTFLQDLLLELEGSKCP